MNRIHVLDCTLRDGGYCNHWKFGSKNIDKVIAGLIKANIDVIECGYISQKVEYDINSTLYTTFEEANSHIPVDKMNKIFVAMINYGEYDINKIPQKMEKGIDGIRVAFHKKNMQEAIDFCKRIEDKGYKVFVQPMVSVSYSDEEFINLINYVNSIKPYAFYIVDSFGMMKKKDLIRLFYIVEHNLDEDVWIGFHSHNNMQLAYANAQCLVDIQTSRDLLIDASIYGMGRGAGNLNTELFVDYLNEYTQNRYFIRPLLHIIDEILNDFYRKNFWGYSLSKYLSASHNIHPNYAIYYEEKNTLTVEAMDEIFSLMDIRKKYQFDKQYAEEIYLSYMVSNQKVKIYEKILKSEIEGKRILLIAPGKSVENQKDIITEFMHQNNVISVSINFAYEGASLLFVSNMIRFRDLDKKLYKKCIVTSNIEINAVYSKVEFDSLLAPIASIRDNAGLMAVKLMIELGAVEIFLAGFDGYSYRSEENYLTQQRVLITKPFLVDEMNEGISKVLKLYGERVKIKFLTKSIYNN